MGVGVSVAVEVGVAVEGAAVVEVVVGVRVVVRVGVTVRVAAGMASTITYRGLPKGELYGLNKRHSPLYWPLEEGATKFT